MKKIKIVFIHWALYMGGTQHQFLEMVRRLDRNRFDLKVLAFRSSGGIQKEIEALNIPVMSLELPPLKGEGAIYACIELCKFMWAMLRYLRREKPHIAQSYLAWTNICGSFAAKLAGVPVIITGRRANIHEKYMRCPKFPDQFFQNLSNVWTTAVITNSHVVKRECLERERFLGTNKIHVIYNGVDTNRYTVSSSPCNKKRALGIPEKALVVGIIASLHPRKGHHIFLNAAKIVLQIYPATTFLLVGQDVGIREELERLAEHLNILNSVIFTGERHDIPDILSILDVQVSASFIEGLSNAILEGMAAGKAIAATDIAGNSELIIHDQTGVLVPPGNPVKLAEAIIGLLGNKTWRDRLGHAGRRRVYSKFQMGHMIWQIEALYQSLVKNTTRRIS